MLKRLFIYYGKRNFSQSRIWRNLEKVKPNELQETSHSGDGPKMNYAPNEFERKILVWSGKFKSKKDVPTRISFGVLEDAKSRFRIRVANWMMVFTLFLCAYYVWKGKTDASQGYSINQMYFEKYGKESKEKKN